MKDYYRYWNNFNPYAFNLGNDNLSDILNRVLKNTDFFDKADSKGIVKAKITKGDKIYRVVVEDITPVKEDIKIEFEDEEPDRHPDFTE